MDPEWVGYMLMNNLQDHQFTDFQPLPSWRRLVPLVADEVTTVTGEDLVVDTTDLATAEVVSAIVASVPAERVTA